MSIERVNQAFKQCGDRAALIPYIPAGDPSPQLTLSLMHAAVKAGVDLIELGVPFSDPMADGPVIQKATQRAIANGMTLKGVLNLVSQFREQNTDTPIILMGYANQIEAMGRLTFAQEAEKAGVDGILIVDYPPEEYDDFGDVLKQHGISPIFLLAPTSTEKRIQAVAEIASGFVYYVSLKGVTGSASINVDEVKQRVEKIKETIKIPVGVGFGISSAQNAQTIGMVADAVVIGSKLIQITEEALNDQMDDQAFDRATKAVHDWLLEVRTALE